MLQKMNLAGLGHDLSYVGFVKRVRIVPWARDTREFLDMYGRTCMVLFSLTRQRKDG
jgi:hypothetical protein